MIYSLFLTVSRSITLPSGRHVRPPIFRNALAVRMPRRGIFNDVRESGTARLIFQKDEGILMGMLETTTGGTLSINGKISEGSPEPSTSTDPYIMDFLIVDGEEGTSYKLDNINVFVEGRSIRIDNPALNFTSERRVKGEKADVIIHQYLQPGSMAFDHNEVYVGAMKLHVLTNECPKQEQSDDFLA
ncbi:unnamed protein product [Cylicocyclus nassatus]|uniref:Uncharacterized protein n=1 Tax=Cylicocyclus nassatus TaxID=53992 RepID=A0AA36DK56_CYLNA|nr:unnamed protein product [Cylicocyclus nassatus]